MSLRSNRFFAVLHRVNAVLFLLLLLFFGVMLAVEAYRSAAYYSDEGAEGSEFASEAEPGRFTGSELVTADGTMVAYEVADPETMGREEGSNVTFVNGRTGESRLVAPDGSSVVRWEVLEREGDDDGQRPVAIGYLAFVANAEQFRAGRMDLVVGSLPGLQQVVVAENVKYADIPQVHGDGSLAMVIWPEEEVAHFVTVDIESGRLIDRREIALPRIGSSELQTRPLANAGRPIRRTANEMAEAPIATYVF